MAADDAVYDDPDNQLDNKIPEPPTNADAAGPADVSQTPFLPEKEIGPDAIPLDEVEEDDDTATNHQENEDAYSPSEDQESNIVPPDSRDQSGTA
jgi:hypothetical protein